MHSLLEAYLSKVTKHLGPMPVKQRNEELREVRLHLENAVIVSRELGQSEEEAAQSIVAQFGTAEDLGENVVWAWRRGVVRDKRSFWGAAVCTLIMLVLMPLLLLCFVITPLEHTISPPFSPQWKALESGYDIVNFVCIVAAGAINGVFFSKRAIAGTALAAAIYSGFCFVSYFCHPLQVPCSLVIHMIVEFAVQSVEVGLAALFSAWACRWWKQKRQRVWV